MKSGEFHIIFLKARDRFAPILSQTLVLNIDATQTDLNPFFDEYTEKGELAADSYTKLEGMGLSKEVCLLYTSPSPRDS